MQQDEPKIVWHLKTSSISQIPQEGLEYALVSEKYEQIHQFIWCKDFIQDAIFGYVNSVRASIYGFSYDPKDSPPIYLKKTRMIISNFKDTEFSSKVPVCLDFLHQIEKQIGMGRTQARKCAEPPRRYAKAGIWLLDGARRWMISPPMVSLYTLLIRVGFVHQLGDTAQDTINKVIAGSVEPYFPVKSGENDVTFLRDGKTGIDWILTYGDKRLFHRTLRKNYQSEKKIEVGTMHASCGIMAYSRRYPESMFPRWYEAQKEPLTN